MANRSNRSELWAVRAFLLAWLAGALYVCLLAVHWLFGVPWHPVLGVAGALLFAVFLCGFSASLIGHGITQIRESLVERRPVTWQGKLVGWVVAPTPDESGGETGRWLPARSPDAAAFLAALSGAPGAETQASVGDIPSRIELRPDESCGTLARWCVSPPDAAPPAAADNR
jgi:hypothetical protein